MNAFDVLTERGFIAQLTHGDEMKELFQKEKITFYNGYDPTADSLTTGHLLTCMALHWLQADGHRPIMLVGGGTGMVGDPDKVDSMRPLMDIAEIDRNVECLKAQLAKFIDFTDGKAVMVNNADWLRELRYADFIREYGIHFSVNRMLSADKYKTKYEGDGLSFFELNYMVMQAYDFLELNRRYGCVMQTGGNDQWSNIIAGVELIRRIDRKPAYGMTFTLLLNAKGEKMGKTLGGAVYLSPERTTPYDFFQYWRNVDDASVRQMLSLMTYLPMERVNELANLKGNAINEAKEVLAYEVTKTVHGEEEAEKALSAAKTLFAGGGDVSDIPTVELKRADIENGILLANLLEEIGLAPSRAEARRLIQQGGIIVAGEKVDDVVFSVTPGLFKDGELLVQKGKKFHKKVRLV
jgi:tyrosyl-tRNA synthetase